MTKRNYMMIDREGGREFYQSREELFADMQEPLDDDMPLGVFEVIFDGKRVSEMVNITEVMIERLADFIMAKYEDKADYEYHNSTTREWLEQTDAYESFMYGTPKGASSNDPWFTSSKQTAQVAA